MKKSAKNENTTDENTKSENTTTENAKKKKGKNPHDGHRKRIRKRYLDSEESFELHEFIEIALYHALPRKNTNEIAHALINKFKTFDKILEADLLALKEIEGISDTTAFFFKTLLGAVKRYNLAKARETEDIKSKSYYEEYLIGYYKTEVAQEKVLLLTLNAKMGMISEDIIYVGSVNSAEVDMNKMMRIALVKNASSVILAHNHPNGIAVPSPEDIETTKRILNIFQEVKINFIDHYVVAGNKIASIRDKMVKDYFA